MAPTSEARAREQIDALLRAAGWAIQDYRALSPGTARGNNFCKQITYQAKHPISDKPADCGQLIKDFRNTTHLRIAVTVDMIATSTDIKPLEVLLFLRDVLLKELATCLPTLPRRIQKFTRRRFRSFCFMTCHPFGSNLPMARR